MTPEEFWELLDDYRSAVLNGRQRAWRQYAVAEEKLTGDAVAAAFDALFERNKELEAELAQTIKSVATWTIVLGVNDD